MEFQWSMLEERPFAKLFEKSVLNKVMLILTVVFATIIGFGAALI
jgi:hypothetical protein